MLGTDMKRDRAEGFDALVGPHLEVLWRAARSLSNGNHDAEDLIQETLLRAYRSLDTFDGRYPRAWLLTIMRNANINRHRRRRPVLLDHADDIERAQQGGEVAASAEDVAVAAMTSPALVDALERLSPRHRDVVVLVDVEGLSYNEAAAIIGVPVGTVMSRLHRARHPMRARLNRVSDQWSNQP